VPSYTSQYLAPEGGPPATSEVEELVLWTAAALYAGAFDTVGITIPNSPFRASRSIHCHLDCIEYPSIFPVDGAES